MGIQSNGVGGKENDIPEMESSVVEKTGKVIPYYRSRALERYSRQLDAHIHIISMKQRDRQS